MSEYIRVGIIGIGNMGSGHADNIVNGMCPRIKLCAIADTNPERLAWAQKKYGKEIAYFNTAEEMLDSSTINSCIVSVPHYDHPKYAMECMKRGIHVMVEKPAGVYTRQVRNE